MTEVQACVSSRNTLDSEVIGYWRSLNRIMVVKALEALISLSKWMYRRKVKKMIRGAEMKKKANMKRFRMNFN